MQNEVSESFIGNEFSYEKFSVSGDLICTMSSIMLLKTTGDFVGNELFSISDDEWPTTIPDDFLNFDGEVDLTVSLATSLESADDFVDEWILVPNEVRPTTEEGSLNLSSRRRCKKIELYSINKAHIANPWYVEVARANGNAKRIWYGR
jgi:hypothetical protein